MIRNYYQRYVNMLHSIGIGKFSPQLRKNAKLKNSVKQYDRCFILATGPSIKEQDLTPLQKEFCISVSNFFVHADFKNINPYYHVFAGAHPPITTEQMISWWREAALNIPGTARTNLLLHANDQKINNQAGIFPESKVYYYASGGDFPVDFTTLLPQIQTVVHIAIYLAIYLGIKKIYLLGCDHSWLLHFGKSRHFYQEEQHAFTKNNYNEWQEVEDIGSEFHSHAILWDIYRKIRNETKKQNVQIYNCTPGSLLDIFPKIHLSEVLK